LALYFDKLILLETDWSQADDLEGMCVAMFQVFFDGLEQRLVSGADQRPAV